MEGSIPFLRGFEISEPIVPPYYFISNFVLETIGAKNQPQFLPRDVDDSARCTDELSDPVTWIWKWR